MHIRKIILLTFICIPLIGYCQQSSPLIQEISGLLSHNEQQMVSLAEAIPAEKYSWSPQDGVRTVAQVLMHTASANYFFMAAMGFELPQGVDPTKLESITDKKQAIETLKNSFAFLKTKAALLTEANMNEKFKLPFGEFSKRMGLLILVDHSGEHKGQLIAYARSNGIKPPWSDSDN